MSYFVNAAPVDDNNSIKYKKNVVWRQIDAASLNTYLKASRNLALIIIFIIIFRFLLEQSDKNGISWRDTCNDELNQKSL